MKKCPACDREFKGIEDFPRVKIISFKEIEVTSEYLFPDNQEVVPYSGPKVDPRPHEEVPEKVLKYFKDKQQHGDFIEGKYRWDFYSAPGDPERGLYHRYEGIKTEEVLNDVKPYLDEYFKILKESVEEEVEPKQIMPKDIDSEYDIGLLDSTESGNTKAEVFIGIKRRNMHWPGFDRLVKVAEIKYEGLLLEEEETIMERQIRENDLVG